MTCHEQKTKQPDAARSIFGNLPISGWLWLEPGYSKLCQVPHVYWRWLLQVAGLRKLVQSSAHYTGLQWEPMISPNLCKQGVLLGFGFLLFSYFVHFLCSNCIASSCNLFFTFEYCYISCLHAQSLTHVKNFILV